MTGNERHPRRAKLLARWGPVVNCVADLLGPNAEVVLHDAAQPARSIIMIRHGHVTGRGLGAPLTDLGLFMLREPNGRIDTLGVYDAHTEDGRTSLKCNAANLRNDRGEVEAILCVNIAVTQAASTRRVRRADAKPSPEHYQRNILQVLQTMVDDARSRSNGHGLTRDEKIAIVRELDARGMFLARGAIRRLAQCLKIATPTVYKYINLARRTRPSSARKVTGKARS